MGDPIRLVICDDNESLRRALVRLLDAKADIEIAGEAGSVEELLALVGANDPGVVLLDVNLPGLSGLDGLARLREQGCKAPVMVMSADRWNQGPAEEAGAAGFFFKGTTDVTELVDGIRSAVRGR